MTLMDTVNKLGHYAKKAAKIVLKPVNTAIAIIAISSMSIGDVQGQDFDQDRDILGDTIYGTGIFQTIDDENGNFINDVTLYLRPEAMAMVIPDTTYEFITANDGWVEFNNPGLPVYIDSTTGQEEYYESNTTVFPNPGSEINVDLPSKKIGVFTYYNTAGQLVGSTEFNSDKIYVDVSKEAAGPLFYRITLEDKMVISGIYIKQNVPSKGQSSKGVNNFKSSNKTQFYEATYWAKWEHPDFYTDSTLITLVDGDNGFINFFMTSNIIPIPQHQDIAGIAKDDENGNGPLENVTAILYNQTLNETTTLTTGSNGEYVFEDVPIGSVCFISVGGLDDYYSWNDIEYTVPSWIYNMNDTIMDEASAVMYAVQPDIGNFPSLIQMTNNGTLTGERTYWFDSSVSSSDRTVYINSYAQYDAQIGGHTHTQTTVEDSADIKIHNGPYNTARDVALVSSPFGDLFPATNVSMYLNTAGGYGSLSHEYGQGDGMSQGGSGYLSSIPPPTGPTAEDIAVDVIDFTHWVENVYGPNNETWFDLNNLSETLNNKSPEFSPPVIPNPQQNRNH